MSKTSIITPSIAIVLNGTTYWVGESIYKQFSMLKLNADIAVYIDESRTQPAILNGTPLMIKMSNVSKELIS
jgi:hypothetical protein